LGRLTALKAERLQYLIDEQRALLSAAWEQLRAGLPTPVVEGELGDELLQRYKSEVARVQALVERSHQLITWIERRERILQSKSEYDELRSDPARLMGILKNVTGVN